MALAPQYATFRSTRDPSYLAATAALHYVTAAQSVKEPAAIEKHLVTQAKQLKVANEEVLHTVEASTQLVQEIETTLEFVSGGGAYLPGLDSNLVIDQKATLPVVHVVQFDGNRKIEQIRLHWDQGVLLKSVGVIGARAANWPIIDGGEQAKLIRASAKAASKPGDPAIEAVTKSIGDATIASRPTATAKPTNDSRASRDLTPSPEVPGMPIGMGATESPSKAGIPAKAGAGMNFAPNRLFEADEQGEEKTPEASRTRTYIKPHEAKFQHFNLAQDEEDGGAEAERTYIKPHQTKFQHFDLAQDQTGAGSGSDEKERTYIKPNENKFKHFDFYDGDDAPTPRPPAAARTQHQSQLDFADFATPAKPRQSRMQSQGAHHFSFDDNELADSPVKKPAPPKARPDASSQFELQDDGGETERATQRPTSGRGARTGHNRNESSLWQSQTDDGGPEEVGTRPYSQSSVVSQKDRQKDFGAHWQMTDDAAVADAAATDDLDTNKRAAGVGSNMRDRSKDFNAHWAIDDEKPGAIDEAHDASQTQRGVTQNMSKVLETFKPHWEVRDDSPGPANEAEARILGGAGGKENKGIKLTGDGMGGRKATSRQWGFGDDNGDEPAGR